MSLLMKKRTQKQELLAQQAVLTARKGLVFLNRDMAIAQQKRDWTRFEKDRALAEMFTEALHDLHAENAMLPESQHGGMMPTTAVHYDMSQPTGAERSESEEMNRLLPVFSEFYETLHQRLQPTFGETSSDRIAHRGFDNEDTMIGGLRMKMAMVDGGAVMHEVMDILKRELWGVEPSPTMQPAPTPVPQMQMQPTMSMFPTRAMRMAPVAGRRRDMNRYRTLAAALQRPSSSQMAQKLAWVNSQFPKGSLRQGGLRNMMRRNVAPVSPVRAVFPTRGHMAHPIAQQQPNFYPVGSAMRSSAWKKKRQSYGLGMSM